ncbi:hypothetical protein [Methylobacterium oxalidis]|uniref:hypothetical protein n=1 Tax=Methylobacterium oxalidis TaxID=944322 RepID=UPI0014787877|nr:hypothetical protein [Methylobacterium oxalidis]
MLGFHTVNAGLRSHTLPSNELACGAASLDKQHPTTRDFILMAQFARARAVPQP